MDGYETLSEAKPFDDLPPVIKWPSNEPTCQAQARQRLRHGAASRIDDMTATIALPRQTHSDWLARLRTISMGLAGAAIVLIDRAERD